jgi:hypothetical protein
MAKAQDNAVDWNSLAAKLLDLWQDHLSAVAQDPNLTAQMLRLLAINPAQAGASDSAQAWFQNPWARSMWGAAADGPGGMNVGGFAPRSDFDAPKARPKASAATPDVGASALGELVARLAGIERRLAAIENRARGKRRRAAGKNTKPVPAIRKKPRKR